MQEFVESSLPSRCLATPEASFLSIWKSENAELAPRVHLGASRQTLVSGFLHMNSGFRKPWKPGSNQNCKPISDPQKSINFTEHLRLLQYIYACFLNKYFQICLYLFKIKLNTNFSKNNKTLRSCFPFWPALSGLIQCHTTAYIIQLHCKVGGKK